MKCIDLILADNQPIVGICMKDKLIVFWQSHSETIITLGYKVVLALAILVASALIARSVKKAIKNSKSPLKKVDETEALCPVRVSRHVPVSRSYKCIHLPNPPQTK